VTRKLLGFFGGAVEVFILLAYGTCFETVWSSHLQELKCPVKNSSLDISWFVYEPAEAGNYFCTLSAFCK
jgi:hypothetical protein